MSLTLPSKLFAQTDSLAAGDSLKIMHNSMPVSHTYTEDINAPAKAAFYSAILPGGGQAYNRQYWKIPIVYAALGTAFYFYRQNNLLYHQYRDAYQNRLLGLPDPYPEYDTETLIKAQNYYRRNRDIALMLSVLAYALNIIEANVAAHLRQWNINGQLSFKPIRISPYTHKYTFGFHLRLTF